jgi:DNA-binding PadR family transcriptional regulator
MSIPAVITALLASDSAYGLQLHKEIVNRLPHRASTNVGQIYSTLERLQRDGVIASAGSTSDGLPRYATTQSGQLQAQRWLAAETLGDRPDWSEFLDLALIAATLLPEGIALVRAAIHEAKARLTPGQMSTLAPVRLSEAMLAFLDDVDEALSSGKIVVRGIDQTRPARGRKPNSN